MPFTFSHPAIILPFSYFWQKRFSATALIVGSIAPDFEYFIRFRNSSHHSHTWAGMFWFDLPAGFIICFVFHDIVKTPLFVNLPSFLRKRFMPFLSFNWKHYFLQHRVIVVYSLLIGIVSHILWDRLNHESYSFFNTIPSQEDSLAPGFHPNKLYRTIQISYSLSGLAVIAIAIWRLPVDHSISDKVYSRPYWISFGFIAASMLGVSIVATGFEYMDWIIAVLSSLIIGLVASSFLQLEGKRMLVKGWR